MRRQKGDEELLGWRTRLIERAGVTGPNLKAHKATTIPSNRHQGTLSPDTLNTSYTSANHYNPSDGNSNINANNMNTNLGGSLSLGQGMNNGFGTNRGGGGGNGWIPPVQQVLQQHLVPVAEQADARNYTTNGNMSARASVMNPQMGNGMGGDMTTDTSTDLLVSARDLALAPIHARRLSSRTPWPLGLHAATPILGSSDVHGSRSDGSRRPFCKSSFPSCSS